MKGDFKELLKMIRNQDLLRSNGFSPIGWFEGRLIWKRDAKEDEISVTKILTSISSSVKTLDDINAILIS